MSELTWTPTRVKLADLQPWERNPKRMSRAQATRLEASTGKLGRAGVLLVGPPDANGKRPLYDGHQRAKVWGALYGAATEVVALEADRELTDEERRATSLLTVTAAASFDWDALASWDVGELVTWGLDTELLAQWNDDAANLREMLEAEQAEPPADPGPQIDRAEELREKWGVEVGQLWRLGEHRLICGDCTDKAVVERAMGGEKARMVWTDPPYGVNYGADAKHPSWRQRTIENDNLPADELEQLIRDAFSNCSQHAEAGASIYAACPAGTLLPTAISAFDGSGFQYRWQLVWVKDSLVLGRSDYHFRHENILYGWKPDAAHYFTDDRTKDSVFEIPRPKRSDEHPTMKPPALIEAMLSNSSLADEIVIDPFCGSGSTLVACERLGRKCRAVEIEPKYVAVTLDRWATMTGKTPELVG